MVDTLIRQCIMVDYVYMNKIVSVLIRGERLVGCRNPYMEAEINLEMNIILDFLSKQDCNFSNCKCQI